MLPTKGSKIKLKKKILRHIKIDIPHTALWYKKKKKIYK